MTRDMIKRLFPDTRNIDAVVSVIDQYKDKFGLNTDLRLGHFLAQVREEVGSEFKVLRENLNYRSDALRNTFGNRFTEAQAREYGRGVNSANQEMIANIAYANRLGNGDADSGDGWKYRGAGVLQVTGKDNYAEVQRRIDKYAPTSNIDIIMYPKDIHTLEGSILASLGFWIWKDLYKIADKGTSEVDVDNITRVINLHTESYLNRRQHFLKIRDLIN